MNAALALGAVGLVAGLLLALAKAVLRAKEKGNAGAVVEAIDALLPQSQCAQCGYPGCRPYAQAVADGELLDLCVPGGPRTVARLQALLGRDSAATELPTPKERTARIVAADCVGCALCIDACPVDAIAGAPKYLHAVIDDHCTGCELCVPACPVDCIEMVDAAMDRRTPRSAVNGDLPPLGDDVDAKAVIERIEAAGIVGMGGAGYPTARKLREALASGVDTVIGNGMASEPEANADRVLLRDRFAEVAAGLRIVGDCLGARALLAVPPGSGLPEPAVEVLIPFPAGDERRLVQELLSRDVPPNGHPTDAQAVVFNVATLFAVFEAVRLGKPLRRRLVTVDGSERWLALGTPLAELGIDGPLRIGGALSGRPVGTEAVVEARTFCVSGARPAAESCIHCGWCEPACPAGLSPVGLHDAFERGVDDQAAFNCIECGGCTAVCPSGIDLVNEFRALKTRMRTERGQREAADVARRRFEARAARLAGDAERAATEREERLRQRRAW